MAGREPDERERKEIADAADAAAEEQKRRKARRAKPDTVRASAWDAGNFDKMDLADLEAEAELRGQPDPGIDSPEVCRAWDRAWDARVRKNSAAKAVANLKAKPAEAAAKGAGENGEHTHSATIVLAFLDRCVKHGAIRPTGAGAGAGVSMDRDAIAEACEGLFPSLALRGLGIRLGALAQEMEERQGALLQNRATRRDAQLMKQFHGQVRMMLDAVKKLAVLAKS